MHVLLQRCAQVLAVSLLATVAAPGQAPSESTRDVDNIVVAVSTHDIREAAVVHQDPEYPAAARQFRLSGEVVAELVVGVNGKVENVSITKGPAILSEAVVRALRKWSFTPFKVDGRVRRVKSTLSFTFRL
jgi:TonB family protein